MSQLEYNGSESSSPQAQPESSPEIKPEVKPETRVKRKDRKIIGKIVEITSDDQIDSSNRRRYSFNKSKSGRRVHGLHVRGGCIEIVGHLVIDNGKKTRKQVTYKSQSIISEENSTGSQTRKEIIPLKRTKTRKGVYTKSNTDKRVSSKHSILCPSLSIRIGRGL